MTQKNALFIIGGLFLNIVAGFLVLQKGEYSNLPVLASFVYFIWIMICLNLSIEKDFSLTNAGKVILSLTICMGSELVFPHSFFGLLFLWPFMGISYFFSTIFEYKITICILYLILMGTILFFAFWESNSRYLLNAVPFMIMMAADTLWSLYEYFMGKKSILRKLQ